MNTNSAYIVQGMTCGSCATKVTSAVDQVAGVTNTNVDLTTGTLTVDGPDIDDIDDIAVRAAISDAGFQIG